MPETRQLNLEATKEFMDALGAGNITKIRQQLAADPSLPHARNKNGVSAVVLAMYSGHRDIAELLSSKKPELDIFEASSVGNLGRVRELVRQNPGLVNSYSPDGFTPLGLASHLGNKDVVQYLLEKGADVNATSRNQTGFSPLMAASEDGNKDIVKLLLAQGADIHARTNDGKTALSFAVEKGHNDVATLLKDHGARQ